MDESLEEQVRKLIAKLHPSLVGEDLDEREYTFDSVVELISMALTEERIRMVGDDDE